MRKILFILRDYEHGGIPRVLANLLDCLDKDKYSISLYVCNPVGMFKDSMHNCIIEKENFYLEMVCCNYRKTHGLKKVCAIGIKVLRILLKKLFHIDLLKIIEKCVANRFNKHYDVVWACSDDVPAHIAEMCESKVKILWIHNNYASIFTTLLSYGKLPNYLLFNKIICVSYRMAEIFIETLRDKLNLDVSQKVETLHNIVNYNEIVKLSQMCPIEYSSLSAEIIFVSVGRLAYEKNFECIPKIVSLVRKQGISNIKWFIIGDGAPVMWRAIEGAIEEYQVKDNVILLGVKPNPYPYIAHSNLLVLTSRHEAYPTVINEAKALGIPVLATPFDGVNEIIKKNDGWVCDVNYMPERIISLIKNGKINGGGKDKVDFSKYNLNVKEKFEKIIES